MTLDVARARMHAQRMLSPLAAPAEVVAHLVAVQSQDYYGGLWAVGQRAKGATAASVERAYDAGELLRTHVLRPTWHFVTPADARWLLTLSAPRVHAACAYGYRTAGLTAARLARTDAAIAAAVAGGPLTREELGKRLGKLAGISLGHALVHAELERIIISGPRRGKHATYAAFDARVPPSPAVSRDDALALLARRFVTSHGPTQAKDLAWWAGLALGEARRALELAGDALEHVTHDGIRYAIAPARVPARRGGPTVHLLPNYDELLVAFADRSAARDPRAASLPKTMYMRHTIASDGRVIGTWQRLADKRTAIVRAALVARPTAAERSALEAEVARFGRFLGTTARLETSGRA